MCVCVCGSILEFFSSILSHSLSFFLYISVALSMESSFETLNHCIKMNIRDDNISSIEKRSNISSDLFHSFIYFAGVFFLSLLLVFPTRFILSWQQLNSCSDVNAQNFPALCSNQCAHTRSFGIHVYITHCLLSLFELFSKQVHWNIVVYEVVLYFIF